MKSSTRVPARALAWLGLGLAFIAFSQLDFVSAPNSFFFSYCLLFPALFFVYQVEQESSPGLAKLLFFALISTGLFLGKDPILSDDLYRYLAEGNAQKQGINPYLVAPQDYGYQDELTSKVNHPQYTAIYPPFFQLVMKSLSYIGYSVLGLQIFCLFAFLITGILIYKLAENKADSVFYFFNPFIVVEGVWHAHIELLISFLLIAGLYLFTLKKEFLSSLSLGAAIALKWVPAIYLPLLFLKLGNKRTVIGAGFVTFVSFLFFLDAPFAIFDSLSTYVGHWEFASPLFKGLLAVGLSKTIVKVLLLALFLSCFGLLCRLLWQGKLSLAESFSWTSFIFPYCGATLYPWYILPAAVLFPLTKHWFVLAFCLFSMFTYHTVPDWLTKEIWMETNWQLLWNSIPLLVAARHIFRELSLKKLKRT